MLLCSIVLTAILLARARAAPLLEDIQVAPPVLTPNGLIDDEGKVLSPGVNVGGCVVKQVLVEHVFGNSYGVPFIGMHLLQLQQA